MTPAEHYAKAESAMAGVREQLQMLKDVNPNTPAVVAQVMATIVQITVASAQVHASLATVSPETAYQAASAKGPVVTRLDWGATHPKTRHRFCLAGSPMAIDSAPVYVEASGGEPVKLDLSSTALLQVLAAELREAGLLEDFVRAAYRPYDTDVQQQVLPRIRLHERVVSALTLTWTADMARDVAAQLVEAADVAESDDEKTFQFAAGAVDLTQADENAEVAP